MSNVYNLFTGEAVYQDYQPTESTETHYTPPQRKPKPTRERCGGLTFYPRLNLWKASNVTLDADSLEAESYSWWRFLECINGQLVFNDYSYSRSTLKHQAKVRRWLYSKGLTGYITIESPGGLQDLYSAVSYYKHEITKLDMAINKPRSQKKKNEERKAAIKALEGKIRIVEGLMAERVEA